MGHYDCPCMEKCPLQHAMLLIGGKWKVQILCAVCNAGSIRYNALRGKLDGVSNTVLSSALKELERDGLVYSQRTSGRYVTEDQTAITEARHALAADRVRSFLTDMERLGFEKEDLLSLLRQESEKE